MTKEICLTDKQIQFLEASYDHPVVFFGGARGGGKSYGLRNLVLIRALEKPGLHIALFRKTYPELRANHIDPLLIEHPELREYFNKSEHIIRLPNSSIIEFCHCQNRDDVHLYQGREYDVLCIDEAGQWEEQTFQTLRGSNRSAKPGVKPVTLLTGNPGGIGHQWLKRLFIERSYNERERPDDYYFIQSKVYDCPPLIDNDPNYVHRLEAEPNQALRRAYLDGDWDVFAGQFFGEWRREIHVLPADFKIEKHWTRFAAFDPGYFHPSAFGWFAVDEQGAVYLYRELVQRGLRIDEIAREVKKFEDSSKLTAVYAGLDCWAKGRDGSPSIAEQFATLPNNITLNLVKANTDRIQGASQVRAYLAWKNLPVSMKGPRFFATENCTHSINCIPRMIHDPNKPEDVLKVDATETDPHKGDDCYDMIRYALMSRPLPSQRAQDFQIIPYEQRVQAWSQKRKKMSRQKNLKSSDSTLGGQW